MLLCSCASGAPSIRLVSSPAGGAAVATSEFQGQPSVAVPIETVIAWQAPPLKFGIGATEEVGYELRRLGVTKALIVTDPNLSQLGLPRRVSALIEREGIETEVYDRSHVEPTDVSFRQALSDLEGRSSTATSGSAAAARSTPPRPSTCSRPTLPTS